MEINNHTYKNDLIISWDEIKSNWWRKEGHNLNMEDLEYIVKRAPEKLIIGTGAHNMMEVSNILVSKIKDLYDINIIVKPTPQAVNIFNECLQKDERVMGAFHLTC